jgi:hypothetical protein
MTICIDAWMTDNAPGQDPPVAAASRRQVGDRAGNPVNPGAATPAPQNFARGSRYQTGLNCNQHYGEASEFAQVVDVMVVAAIPAPKPLISRRFQNTPSPKLLIFWIFSDISNSVISKSLWRKSFVPHPFDPGRKAKACQTGRLALITHP